MVTANPEIRLSRAMRIYIVAFGVVWCGTLLTGLTAAAADGAWGSLPVVMLMLAWGGFFMTRMYGLAVVAGPGELVVRNLFRTRPVPKSAIEGFRLGTPTMAMPFSKTIHVLLNDDTVLTADVFLYSIGPGSRRRREKQLELLRAWLAAG